MEKCRWDVRKTCSEYCNKFKEKMDADEIRQVNILKGKYIDYKIKGKSLKVIRDVISPLKFSK
jgi:hypothetical protein